MLIIAVVPVAEKRQEAGGDYLLIEARSLLSGVRDLSSLEHYGATPPSIQMESCPTQPNRLCVPRD